MHEQKHAGFKPASFQDLKRVTGIKKKKIEKIKNKMEISVSNFNSFQKINL